MSPPCRSHCPSFSAIVACNLCFSRGCSGGINPGDPDALQQQVAALERAAAAVVDARQRQRAWRQQKRADAAVAALFAGPAGGGQWPAPGTDAGGAAPPKQLSRLGGAANASVGSARQPPSRLGSGSPGGSSPASTSALGSLGLLHCLQPTARIALLLSLEQRQRQQMLAAMSDSERAGLMVQLEESARLQVDCCWLVGRCNRMQLLLLRHGHATPMCFPG